MDQVWWPVFLLLLAQAHLGSTWLVALTEVQDSDERNLF